MNSPVNPILDGYFVLGEGSALEQLMDAMNREEARDVSVEIDSDWYFDCMRSHHLQEQSIHQQARVSFNYKGFVFDPQ